MDLDSTWHATWREVLQFLESCLGFEGLDG